MPANTFQQWMYNPPMGLGQPGSIEPFFRDVLDARRSMWRRTPDAEYPDGYLGTITTRRGDRLLDSLKTRQNQRSYQRGVHKGERIDMADYFWPKKFQPTRGLEIEATGMRQAPVEGVVTTHLAAEGKMQVPRGALGLIEMNPKRREQIAHLAPGLQI